jgi:hypothetical protein
MSTDEKKIGFIMCVALVNVRFFKNGYLGLH